MWTLFIVSTVIGLEEPKVTRYAEFDHFETCYHAWYEVTSEFTQEEIAYCAEPEE
jgi:hypothetical protein